MAKHGKARPQVVMVNQPAATVVVDFAKFTAVRESVDVSAPIDDYYRSISELLAQSSLSGVSNRQRNLLVVELVATVERYVRQMLVRLVRACPCAAKIVARKQVTIAAVQYYSDAELAFAVLDHQALSGAGEIVRATNQMAGLEIKQGSSLFVALSQFDRVCQLRHAIVHQAGCLGPNNLLDIGIDVAFPLNVLVDVLGFQDLVAICHTAVRAYNQFVFEGVIERWTKEGHLVGKWETDEPLFDGVWNLVVSLSDNPGGSSVEAYGKIWA